MTNSIPGATNIQAMRPAPPTPINVGGPAGLPQAAIPPIPDPIECDTFAQGSPPTGPKAGSFAEARVPMNSSATVSCNNSQIPAIILVNGTGDVNVSARNSNATIFAESLPAAQGKPNQGKLVIAASNAVSIAAHGYAGDVTVHTMDGRNNGIIVTGPGNDNFFDVNNSSINPGLGKNLVSLADNGNFQLNLIFQPAQPGVPPTATHTIAKIKQIVPTTTYLGGTNAGGVGSGQPATSETTRIQPVTINTEGFTSREITQVGKNVEIVLDDNNPSTPNSHTIVLQNFKVCELSNPNITFTGDFATTAAPAITSICAGGGSPTKPAPRAPNKPRS
jgi:hypothetical protein